MNICITTGIKRYFNYRLLFLSLLLCIPVSAHDFGKLRVHSHGLWGLSSYQQLRHQVISLPFYALRPMRAGPLIRQAHHYGILDIDVPLPAGLDIDYQVCGEDLPGPSIRQAVACTVNDGGRGNTDPNQVGFSTQGRELMALRLGNPNGYRVMVITQQHGNEPAATEAALSVARWLAMGFGQSVQQILRRLDIVMLLRANPDGGEPDPRACAIDPEPGMVLDKDCALTRQNVDPSAGGAFTENSEADFVGVVGRGYDLNRYHYAGLEQPIRPVETQAMVAAVLAFRPEVVLDLHGDLQKTDCQLDMSSIQAGAVLGSLPTVACLAEDEADDFRLLSPYADAEPGSEHEFVVQSLAVNVMAKIASVFQGSVGRFSQLQLDAGHVSTGATGHYQQLGVAVAGWETVNFSKDLRADVVAVAAGKPVIGVNLGLPQPELLKKQIWLNRIALFEALSSLAEFAQQAPTSGGDFCDYPLAQGLRANLPAKYWGPQATDGEKLIPIAPGIGLPLYVSGNCPDNPESTK
ncbi:M14 family zinc carboxypeptidase [Agarivorans sp. QJM3NY_29]|uniref:M14 family zinc carboxypeptidase n=1 Tax=unclassified Agarivorans TaxID=2636026 RepID=UPI003D7D79A4